jgi:hypothetical protein
VTRTLTLLDDASIGAGDQGRSEGAAPGDHRKLLGRDFHPFSLLFLVSGGRMISTMKVPKP